MLNLTGFLGLTQISYISLIFRKIVLNLTDVWVMVKKKHRFNPLKSINT